MTLDFTMAGTQSLRADGTITHYSEIMTAEDQDIYDDMPALVDISPEEWQAEQNEIEMMLCEPELLWTCQVIKEPLYNYSSCNHHD